MSKKKESDVWKHFEKVPNEEKARCNYCPNEKKPFAYKQSSTKGLWDHLKSQHAEELEKASTEATSTSVLFFMINFTIFLNMIN